MIKNDEPNNGVGGGGNFAKPPKDDGVPDNSVVVPQPAEPKQTWWNKWKWFIGFVVVVALVLLFAR